MIFFFLLWIKRRQKNMLCLEIHSCNSYVINESSSVIKFGSFSFARFGFGVLTTTVTLSVYDQRIHQFY